MALHLIIFAEDELTIDYSFLLANAASSRLNHIGHRNLLRLHHYLTHQGSLPHRPHHLLRLDQARHRTHLRC